MQHSTRAALPFII